MPICILQVSAREPKQTHVRAQRSEQPSFITFCMGPLPGLTYIYIFKTLQSALEYESRLEDSAHSTAASCARSAQTATATRARRAPAMFILLSGRRKHMKPFTCMLRVIKLLPVVIPVLILPSATRCTAGPPPQTHRQPAGCRSPEPTCTFLQALKYFHTGTEKRWNQV